MTDMLTTATAFFEACETGKGWEGCAAYCTEDATFASQAEPIAEITTLEGYTEWMKGLLTILEDGRYDLKGLSVDEGRGVATAYGVFMGTHTGEGGPVPPTGKATTSDYVYAMEFEDGKIKHMTKVWHAMWAMRELGWA
ncbi:MAG: nuclear transport factor 2 family protein [Pseudomonadota bacterium]